METGIILKGIGGFYYVEAAGQIFECRARGLFRKQGVTPLAGDRVTFTQGPDGTGVVKEIQDRKNYLLRPPIANIDQLAVVVSTCEPVPNTMVIDRTIAAAADKGIEPFVVFSKVDLLKDVPLLEIYQKTGLQIFCVSSVTGEGIDELERYLYGKITAFSGNTGVGKSSLLNTMFEKLHLETGEISRKLGRGRHTTRQVELIRLEGGGYVADTPGFSSLNAAKDGKIKKENLQYCFQEFAPYLGRCKYTSCSHTGEEGCAVLQAVKEGKISKSRLESYIAMYRATQEDREWDRK